MSPAHKLFRLALLLLVTMLILVRFAGSVGGPAYLTTLAVASGLYLLTLRELTLHSHYSRTTILLCLLIGTAWQIPFLMAHPGPKDDVLRYLWDGRLQLSGVNPYTSIPSDPSLAWLHTAETRQMNNQDVPSPYPAGAQLFFRLVAALHPSAFAFKLALALCNVAILWLLYRELDRTGQSRWVLAYAWHPLLVTCVYYNSHIDTLGVLLLLLSIVALYRRRRTLAAVAFGLAIAVKVLPLVLAPLYWRRIRWLDASLALLVVALLYWPFLGRGSLPVGSVSVFVQRFRFNDPLFALLEKVLRPQWATGLAVLCGLAAAIYLRARSSFEAWEQWAWPMAASLLCAPVVYPWYLLWLVPFTRPGATFPLLVWTLSILSVFSVWFGYRLGQPWQVSGWLMLFEFGLVALAALARVTISHAILRERKKFAN